MKPTIQQEAVIAELLTGTGHVALQARAGCGKTSTIMLGIEALSAHDPGLEILVCAFNKSIAVEIQEKLKKKGYDWKKVQASTVHALGFGLLRFEFNPTVDDKKIKNIVARRRGEEERLGNMMSPWSVFRSQIIALVGYAKQAGMGFFDDMQIGDKGVWYELADHFDVNGLERTSDLDQVVECAQVVYRESLALTHVIDYDDMILLPLIYSLRVKFTKDIVFVDEYQDTSRARQALARKFVRPNTGRMVAVGDDRQAIYGFTGADASALPSFIETMGAKVLPLTVTWRCPKEVVKLAQSIVADIEAAEEAAEGEVITLADIPEDLGQVKDKEGKIDEAILCRNTAPLIELAYSLIRRGIPARVEGRKIGEGLVALVERWKVATTDALINKLNFYREREMQKAVAKGNEQKGEEVGDRVDTVLAIVAEVNRQGKHRVDDVVTFINRLFADGETNVVTLATYHRSKGREWRRVCLLEHGTRCPSRAAKQEWQLAQEANLAYVAFTRAKEMLVFVR